MKLYDFIKKLFKSEEPKEVETNIPVVVEDNTLPLAEPTVEEAPVEEPKPKPRKKRTPKKKVENA